MKDPALVEKLVGFPKIAWGKAAAGFEEPREFCAALEPTKVMGAGDPLFIDRLEELVGRVGVRVIP